MAWTFDREKEFTECNEWRMWAIDRVRTAAPDVVVVASASVIKTADETSGVLRSLTESDSNRLVRRGISSTDARYVKSRDLFCLDGRCPTVVDGMAIYGDDDRLASVSRRRQRLRRYVPKSASSPSAQGLGLVLDEMLGLVVAQPVADCLVVGLVAGVLARH